MFGSSKPPKPDPFAQFLGQRVVFETASHVKECRYADHRWYAREFLDGPISEGTLEFFNSLHVKIDGKYYNRESIRISGLAPKKGHKE